MDALYAGQVVVTRDRAGRMAGVHVVFGGAVVEPRAAMAVLDALDQALRSTAWRIDQIARLEAQEGAQGPPTAH
jgi:hypothetical protein